MLKIYGPYLRKDGRKHIVIYDFQKGIRKTKSYPKYIMEKYLGRSLKNNETVDHINNDFTDDRIENLQILSRADNIRKSTPKRKMYNLICSFCKKVFIKDAGYFNCNKKLKRKCYCSKSCAGKGSYVNHYKNRNDK
jgi:hypothetical protein